MGFFIYKQYLYYMKVLISERQQKLILEQNKIKSIINAAKQLDQVPPIRLDLKVPVKNISSLTKKLEPLNKKQLDIINDIDTNKDLYLINKKLNDTYVEYTKVLENHLNHFDLTYV